MMKRIICLFLCGVFLIISSYSIAGGGKEHERDLESVFLGRTLSDGVKDPKKSLINPDNPAVLFGYLEDAIYLCIDQMGNEGQKWLDELNNDYHMEGLPKSLIEATAIGRPIITTQSIGCKDTVDDGVNGFLIAPKEVEPLVEKLRLLIDDAALRQRMGKAAREKAEKEFSLDVVIERHLNIYNELIKK